MKKTKLAKVSTLVKAVAVSGAGARSMLRIHEPKVPTKLRKDKE